MYSDEETQGGLGAADENQDLIEGVDEEGNKILLQVVRYFFYNGEEYVVLGDAQQMDECDESECECCECGCHHDEDEDEEDAVNLYIMKVQETEEDGEDMEEFVPIEDEDLLEKLIEVVQADFDNEDQEDDD